LPTRSWRCARQTCGERIVNAVLDVEAVRADAGLAAVAVLGDDRAFHGRIDVGIVEDDERRIAAEFERQALDGRRRLSHQDAAHFRRARERQLAHDRAGRQHAANVPGVAGDNLQHACRHAGAMREFGQRECGQRRQFGRLDHDRAASGQRRRHLARDHRGREVPRGDGGAHAHRLAQRDQPFVGGRRGQHFTVHALGFLGEPLDETGGVGDLALGFGQRLALLARHQVGQVVGVGQHQVEPAAQDIGALLAGLCRPGFLGDFRGSNGARGLGGAQVGHPGDDLASGRVRDVERGARIGADPLTVDIGQLLEQRRVLELHGEILGLHSSGLRCLISFNRLNDIRYAERWNILRPRRKDRQRARTVPIAASRCQRQPMPFPPQKRRTPRQRSSPLRLPWCARSR
jgi:ParB family chromosome partitioning protein